MRGVNLSNRWHQGIERLWGIVKPETELVACRFVYRRPPGPRLPLRPSDGGNQEISLALGWGIESAKREERVQLDVFVGLMMLQERVVACSMEDSGGEAL